MQAAIKTKYKAILIFTVGNLRRFSISYRASFLVDLQLDEQQLYQ